MSSANIKPSDRVTVLGVIDPQSATAVQGTAWIDVSFFSWVLFILKCGVLGSSTTLDAKVQQATSSAGAGAKDVTGLAITQLTQAGTDASKQVLINVNSSLLDANGGFQFIKLTMTPATSTALIDATALGFNDRHQPGTHATTVDEVVG
jgi:hypothetical protein